jgi:lipopolysaccharide export LptBFGC system permease protein LptF
LYQSSNLTLNFNKTIFNGQIKKQGVSMVGIFIKNQEGNKYVLTLGDSNEYPDLRKINDMGELKSLKLDKIAKQTAKQLFEEELGESYPVNDDNTHVVLTKLFNKVIGK